MNEKARKAVWGAALAAPLAALVFLALITTLSADDYWYSTFFRNGLGGYLALMKEHYLTFNGRMLVHFFAQVTLALGNWAFAPICGGLTAVIPLLSAKAGEKQAPALLAAALFCGALLLLPRSYFATAYLWTSAFFNYVFPTAMLVAELFLLDRFARRKARPAAAALLVVYAFLCGATTEQAGAVAVGLALCLVVEALAFRRERRALWLGLGCAGASLLGLLTVFLSPATLARARLEVGASTLDKLWIGLQREAYLFLGDLRVCLLLSALFLAAAFFLWRQNRRKFSVLCDVAALVPPLAHFLPADGRAPALLLLLLALLACAAALFFLSADKLSACLILGGLGSAAVMLFTNSIAPRTMLPALIFFLAAAARMGAAALEDLPLPACLAAGAVTLAALVSILPQFPGYLYNYRVEQENMAYIREAKTTGVLYCNVDYLPDYTHTKMSFDGYFYNTFLAYAGAGSDVQVLLRTENGYDLYAGDKHWYVPACRVDGVLQFHVRALEALGGTVEYTKGRTEVRLGDKSCVLSGGFAIWEEQGVEQRRALVPVPNLTAFTCLPEDVFSGLFGVTVTVDEAARTVRLSY